MTLVFEAKIGVTSAILEGHAGMADSESRQRNPFVQDVFRPMAAYLQNFSEIGKKPFAHSGLGPLTHALLSLALSHSQLVENLTKMQGILGGTWQFSA